MASKQVSEKTLELNISAELLHLVRQRYPKAYFIGPTNRQEWYRAHDARLGGVRRGMYVVFQYKSPRASYPPNVFSINPRQHRILERRSNSHPDGVWYVFPPYQTFRKLWMGSPNLAMRTYFIRPRNIRLPLIPRTYFRLEISSPVRLVPGGDEAIEVVGFEEFTKAILSLSSKNKISDSHYSRFLDIDDVEQIEGEMREFGVIWRGIQLLCLSEEYPSESSEKQN